MRDRSSRAIARYARGVPRCARSKQEYDVLQADTRDARRVAPLKKRVQQHARALMQECYVAHSSARSAVVLPMRTRTPPLSFLSGAGCRITFILRRHAEEALFGASDAATHAVQMSALHFTPSIFFSYFRCHFSHRADAYATDAAAAPC
jgi:hypothetical protein